MPRGDQLSRQWRLIQFIDRSQGITVDDAARDLDVTIRTVSLRPSTRSGTCSAAPFNDSGWRGQLLKDDERWVYGILASRWSS